MLQEILKSATKEHHDELESLMFVNEIMNKTLTLEQYKTLLATNYIIHAAMESKLHDALDQELKTSLNINLRHKVNALEQDLLEMDMKKEDIQNIGEEYLKMDKTGTAASMGAMYVLEGATLGGHVILKKLKANPAFENLSLNYYSVYGQNLMPNWLTFVNILNTSVSETDFSIAVESASKMFHRIAAVSKAVKSRM